MLDRRSLRLPNYDYTAPGAYFVTICTYRKRQLFGLIRDGQMQLNEWGMIVREEWLRTAEIRHEIKIDEFIVMPDHFHGIVFIKNMNTNTVGAHGCAPKRADGRPPLHDFYRLPRSLGSLIAGFKASVTSRINQFRRSPGHPVWQRNYYEHVIRNERDLKDLGAYIRNNPQGESRS